MPSQTKGSSGKQQNQAYPPELVSKWLNFQQQEIQVRTKELEIKKQQESNNKTIAETSISAQLQDRGEARTHFEKRLKIVFTGIVTIILISAVFSYFVISSGNSTIVMKLVEILSYLTAGFIGGYGFKAIRQ